MSSLNQKLLSEWQRRSAKNSAYSLRSFARSLHLSPGVLSAYMNGKRKITEKAAEKIISRLNLSFEEKLDWEKASYGKQSSSTVYHQLETDQYKVISEWYHFAILSLVKIKDFKPDSDWISGRLGITKVQAENAIERLFRIGMLKNKNNKWVRISKNLKTSDGIPQDTLRYSHLKNLELAAIALERDSVHERDNLAMTLAFDSRKMFKAKALIREFLEKFSTAMDSDLYDEVYKLNIQFFSLIQKGNH